MIFYGIFYLNISLKFIKELPVWFIINALFIVADLDAQENWSVFFKLLKKDENFYFWFYNYSNDLFNFYFIIIIF